MSLYSIVEFSLPEEAQRAIRELGEQLLLGRPVFIREVRWNHGSLARLSRNPILCV